jgi:hypothetical protein
MYGTGDWNGRDGGSYGNRESVLLEHSGFAVLRHPGNKLSAWIDYGDHGGSHGHYDKLHVTVQHARGTVSPDPGMVPYGSSLRKDWYAVTASHNTVSINGQSQAAHTGTLMKYEKREDGVYLWTRSDAAYEGAVLDRHLFLSEHYLLDWFRVELEKEAAVEWWFHSAGRLTASSGDEWETVPGWNPESACGSDRDYSGNSGYDHIELLNRRTRKCAGEDTVLWTCGVAAPGLDTSAELVTFTTLVSSAMEVYEIQTPGISIDPSKRGSGILIRERGRRVDFIGVFCDSAHRMTLMEGNSNPLLKQVVLKTEHASNIVRMHPDHGLELRRSL